jgi:hypothetical protein
MVIAVNEQAEATESESPGKAAWTAPQFARLDIGEAAAGDSFPSADGTTFS